jgi:Ca2+-binding EF-hand superfamily protein
MPGAASLEAFETQYMEPHVLKDQLKKAFFMKVTPQELGAIMHYFDPEDSGRINCSQFLKKMFRVGYEERQRKKELWREHQKQLNERRLEEEKQKMHNLAMKNSIVLSASNKIDQQQLQSPGGGGDGDKNPTTSSGRDFTEKDFQSAFFKLTLGAIKYDRSLPNAMNLTAFECISMPPHIFREQLKLTFNVKVTVPELWALMSYFDKDNTGEINCKKFINQFLRTGYEERNRIKEQWRLMKLMKSENEKNKEMEMKQEKELLAFKECDFDFSENDFNHALYRFVYMCHTVDKRTIGPAGLVAFESESLNPSEFREMLKRTFNFKVNSRELGALVNYFDAHHKKCVHCATFLNTFTQIRAYCEDFKVRSSHFHFFALFYYIGILF